eukprot:151447-Rhodomonas_salina.1
MFRENCGDPDTLADLGVKDDTMERIAEALRSVWADNVPLQPSGDVPEARAADLQLSRRPESIAAFGPFSDSNKNVVWAAACLTDETVMRFDWETLAD